ncbi:MAG TPA: FMN-binding protein [Streptosporangiaceae bacterium]|nr:FMN-binding protein [Streptosporangiaceae bacterium]
MKRAAWYLAAGAVAGFAGVLGLHGRTAPAEPRAAGGAPGRTQPSPSAPSSPSGTGPAAGSSPGRATAGGGTHSVTGALEQFGYGELAVRVTVTGSRITNVTVPAIQTAEPFSRQLSEQAIPLLRSQVLTADSASINGVSGATFTSEAYATSLQAALDKLHLK